MPVQVACKCGKKFTAKDDLIGKVVKCPNCSKPLPIRPPAAPTPKPGSADSMEAVRGAHQPAPAAPPPGPAPMGKLDDLFDEAGLDAAPVGGSRCPSCYAPMQANTIICLECGYNAQSAEFIEQSEEEEIKTKFRKHGNPILDKAEVDLHHDKMELKRSNDPVSWYWYILGIVAIAGIGCSLAMVSMVMTADDDENVTAPFSPWDSAFITCAVIGGTLLLIGWIPTVVRAFKKSTGHGIGTLTVVYAYVYVFMDQRCRYERSPLIFSLIFLGGAIAILATIGFPDPETWKS